LPRLRRAARARRGRLRHPADAALRRSRRRADDDVLPRPVRQCARVQGLPRPGAAVRAGAGVSARPVLLVSAGEATPRWLPAFAQALPELRVLGPEPPEAVGEVQFVAAWRPPSGLFARLPALRAVFALGAGVDAFLAREDLSPAVPLCKLADAGMAAQMLGFVLPAVLAWQRRSLEYAGQQRQRRWQALPARSRGEVRVGVLGLGRIGGAVAAELARMGYRVGGWSRGGRPLEGVRVLAGEAALPELLAGSDVLVNLLPSTPATRGLLDRARLSRLPQGAHLVHAARGDQLDEAALLELL